jgi:hypothetical protein
MPYEQYDRVAEGDDHVIMERSPADGPVERVRVLKSELEEDSEEEPEPEEDTEAEVYTCETCNDVFDSEHGLSIHVGASHEDDE